MLQPINWSPRSPRIPVKLRRRGPLPPRAITVVDPGMEAAFLAPLPVKALWGVGPKTASHLEGMGIRTIGDLAQYPEARLIEHFGKNGADLARHARGIDDSPVVTEHEVKSISQEVTFERDLSDGQALRRTLLDLCESVGRRLRQGALAGTTIRLKLRWSDFTTISRQTTLSQPTDQDGVIFATAYQLFEEAWKDKPPVRLLGVGVSGLGAAPRQLSLWDSNLEKEHRLLEAVDALRQRFGPGVIRRADRLKRQQKPLALTLSRMSKTTRPPHSQQLLDYPRTLPCRRISGCSGPKGGPRQDPTFSTGWHNHLYRLDFGKGEDDLRPYASLLA